MFFKKKQKIEELQKRKIQLLEDNEQLKNKIMEEKRFTEVADEEMKRPGSQFGRGGCYGAVKFLPDFETKWKDTVFWKYREDFIRDDLTDMRNLPERDFLNDGYIKAEYGWTFEFNVMVYCDMAMPTSQGAIIHGFDPYGEYTFAPAKMISPEETQKLTGRLVKIGLQMRYYQENFEVTGVTVLPYDLHNKVA